ncbi:TonB-dependent receptor [Minicystis rosea]|nr:TonB-dependent receptor [Minicystis rosea]
MKRFALPILVALSALPAAMAATPDAQRAPCQGSVDEARRHMERGFDLYDKKQFPEAAAEFDAAYKAQPFSAFLANAAMAYQAALDLTAAIARYEAFLAAEPNPPDLARIRANIVWLKAQQAARLAAYGDAGALDGGALDSSPPPPMDPSRTARSQIIVASDPPDAPLYVYQRRPGAPAFVSGGPNPGWDKVASAARTPHDLSLGPGDYHVVIDAFKDYKRVETDLALLPGHLYELKAVLSQGEFMGFLRVLSPAPGTRIYVDDPPPHKKPPWGRAPHGALLESGPHQVWLEAPGFEPKVEKVVIEHGKTAEVTPALERVRYGYLRVDGNAEEVTVKVDGERRGLYVPIGEPLRIRLASGAHKLELEANGRKTYAGDIEVPRGQELAVHGRLSYKPARSSTVVSGALAVGAIVGGIALLRQAGMPAEPTAGSPPGNAPTNAATWLRVGGGASFAVAALLGASTVYSIVKDPTPPSTVKLDKPKDLDDSELDVPAGGFVPGVRGRVLGDDARATSRRCGVL